MQSRSCSSSKKLVLIQRNQSWLTLGFTAACLCLIPIRSAYGCYGELIESVHFNSTSPDFGTPVRRTPKTWWDSTLERAGDPYDKEGRATSPPSSAESSTRIDGYNYAESQSNDEREAERATNQGMRYTRARLAEKHGDWKVTRELYLQCVDSDGHWTGDLRDSVTLMEQLLAAHTLSAADAASVQRYLEAMANERSGSWIVERDLLDGLIKEKSFILDRALYRRACLAAMYMVRAEAIEYYQRLVNECSTSSKREDALIMIARLSVLPDRPSPTDMAAGDMAIKTLLHDYPHSRFYAPAIGLKGRIHLLRREFSDALWCYFHVDNLSSVKIVCDTMDPVESIPHRLELVERYILRMAQETDDDIPTVTELQKQQKYLTPAAVNLFSKHIHTRPELAIPYVYYRLYYTTVKPSDLAGLAQTVKSAMKLDDRSAHLTQIAVCLAEVEYQRKNYREGYRWAKLAADQHDFAGRDRALFMRASCEHKLGNMSAARKDLETAIDISEDDPLVIGARELLAIVAEETHDFSTAATQYLELGYNSDFAYIVDVLMSSSEVDHYIKKMGSETKKLSWEEGASGAGSRKAKANLKQELMYSLAIHYLRDEQFSKARAVLLKLPASVRKDFDSGRKEYGSDPGPDALTTVNDLDRLKRKAASAHGYEARASAAYAYASYYHTNGALLLYDATLWGGGRVVMFEEFWNSGVESSRDRNALESYLFRHEVYLRSRELCLKVARQFPNSAAAPKALYRAACASNHSSALYSWFLDGGRKKRTSRLPRHEAHDLLVKLIHTYPHSSLIASARKYADVFAQNTPQAEMPQYALGRRSNHDRDRDLGWAVRTVTSAEMDDMDRRDLAALKP